MIFFSEDQIVKIHAALIAKTGGIAGVRDYSLLDLSLHSIFQTFDGKELYPSILDKATQLCYSLIENHPFLDGNKRIGIHIALIFLKINEIELNYSQEELINLGIEIASGKMRKDEIKKWFVTHSK